MGKLSYSDIISSIALVTAVGALAWNIVRDVLYNMVSVKFSIRFGETGNIKNSNAGLFADAGSVMPEHKFDNPSTLVEIANTGHKPIGISGVGGELKTGRNISIVVMGLPKIIQPYEIFSSTSNARENFLEMIRKDEIKNLWVKDTKGKKWLLSVNEWSRLKDTAGYINAKKHL